MQRTGTDRSFDNAEVDEPCIHLVNSSCSLEKAQSTTLESYFAPEKEIVGDFQIWHSLRKGRVERTWLVWEHPE